jgi:hypothetical protein
LIFGVIGIIDSVAGIFGTTIVLGWVIQNIKNPTVRTILRVIEFLICLGLVIWAIICFIKSV